VPDVDFQQLSTVQNSLQPGVRTIASAATIGPTGFMTVISGAAAVVNITPPVSGAHMLVLIPAAAATWTTTAAGNIDKALSAVVAGVPVLAFYNPLTGKYTVGKLVLVAS
jgi:hypothetical protein